MINGANHLCYVCFSLFSTRFKKKKLLNGLDYSCGTRSEPRMLVCAPSVSCQKFEQRIDQILIDIRLS